MVYSFPHRIGAGRICEIAWQQVAGIAAGGAEVTVFPASVHRPLPEGVAVAPTLARGKYRIPYRAIGRMRAFQLHDRIVARRLGKLAGQVDIVHAWPVASLETLRTARRLGIPTVLERPNAHTRFAFEVVEKESARLGIELPPGHEHAFDQAVLDREELEYATADRLLCPSEFVVRTFLDEGFAPEKLVRHRYGYDANTFYPGPHAVDPQRGLTVLFAGLAAVRKGLHFALEAWLRSPASQNGRFLIAGEVLPAYGELLADALAHPSVEVLGQRSDVADLMRRSDVLVLPSIEEGFGLVCVEAMATGCVPLVSDACTDVCRHLENAMVHPVGSVADLEEHITTLHQDRQLLGRLREGCLRTAPEVTWSAAGRALLDAYESVLGEREPRPVPLAT